MGIEFPLHDVGAGIHGRARGLQGVVTQTGIDEGRIAHAHVASGGEHLMREHAGRRHGGGRVLEQHRVTGLVEDGIQQARRAGTAHLHQ